MSVSGHVTNTPTFPYCIFFTPIKATKPFEAWENAKGRLTISLSFDADWMRGCRVFWTNHRDTIIQTGYKISLKSTGKIKKEDTATHSGTEVHRHKRMGGQKEVIQAHYGGKILQHVTIPRD